MQPNTNQRKIYHFLLFYIIVLIGFQQFPVFRIGGSFKIYELLALILLLKYKNPPIKDFKQFLLLVLFVVSPVISFIHFVLCLDIPKTFYLHYPEVIGSFKFDSILFTVLQIIYMLFCYSALSKIYKDHWLYINFDKLRKTTVIIGTCIAIYSLFAIFIYDPIPYLPNFIQNKSIYIFRSGGLSQEPSIYIIYQTWIVLFNYYSKDLFKRKIWEIMLIINISSLILTFSTTLVALMLIILLSVFFGKSTKKQRFAILASISAFLLIGYIILINSEYYGLFETLFIHKIENFLEYSDHTLDSGSFRNYTNRIGWAIFNEHPLLGVGVGNSVFFMHLYEFKMGINTFGEMLHAGSLPQNLFAAVFAEQGIIGGCALLSFLFIMVRNFWENRNNHPYGKMFFIGGLFNISAMFTNANIYALFIWIFLIVALGYNKHYQQTKKRTHAINQES